MHVVRTTRRAGAAPILVSALIGLGTLALVAPAAAAVTRGSPASRAEVQRTHKGVLADQTETGAARMPDFGHRPPPMFTQCPPIGEDTGCQELLTVNADGTVSAQTDPNQPHYDGTDDALLGVVNDSPQVVSSIPLTGTDAFGFDGDGLCTARGAPAGCPFGPTGYEGPGTSFTVTDANDGSVSFTGGLAAGASAYFSLEAVASPLTTSVECQPNVECSDTESLPGTQDTHVRTVSSTAGSITLSVDQSALDCGDTYLHAPLVTTLTTTTLTPTNDKVVTLTIVRSQAIGTPGRGFKVCYSSSTPFVDLYGHLVTTGLLPLCPRVGNTPPCVISSTHTGGIFTEKFVVPASDPRFH